MIVVMSRRPWYWMVGRSSTGGSRQSAIAAHSNPQRDALTILRQANKQQRLFRCADGE
jgi:hypothetical protein